MVMEFCRCVLIWAKDRRLNDLEVLVQPASGRLLAAAAPVVGAGCRYDEAILRESRDRFGGPVSL